LLNKIEVKRLVDETQDEEGRFRISGRGHRQKLSVLGASGLVTAQSRHVLGAVLSQVRPLWRNKHQDTANTAWELDTNTADSEEVQAEGRKRRRRRRTAVQTRTFSLNTNLSASVATSGLTFSYLPYPPSKTLTTLPGQQYRDTSYSSEAIQRK
jgi:hypothetical protein